MTEHRGFRRWMCRAPALLRIGLLLALVSIGLAACGYSGSHPGSAPSTQSQAQVTQTSTPVQKCGSVQGSGSLEVPVGVASGEQAENCFWQAFQHCRPATLVFITSRPGVALIRTFTIHNNNGSCSVSDAMQQRIAANPPSPAETYTCAGLTQQPGGLRFSACGQDGDVVVSG